MMFEEKLFYEHLNRNYYVTEINKFLVVSFVGDFVRRLMMMPQLTIPNFLFN